MTNLRRLPRRRIVFRVGTNEAWVDAIAFVDADGEPIDLAGIGFASTIRPSASSLTNFLPVATVPNWAGRPTVGSLVVGGEHNNVLGWSVPRAAMLIVPPGAYAFDLIAFADIELRIADGTVRVEHGITRP